MGFNNDELITPDWLKSEFFESVLRHSESDDSIKVESYSVLPGTKPGDHFASVIYRVRVIYSSQSATGPPTEIGLIVKCAPFMSSLKKDFLSSTTMFETEIKMYSETLPAIQRLLKLSGETSAFVPRMLYCSQEPTLTTLVFEDISTIGYTMLEHQMELNAATLFFERLGKYHACSFFMNNSNVQQYTTSLFAGPNILTDKIFLGNYNAFLAEIETWSGYEVYYEKLEKMKDDVMKLVHQMYTTNTDADYNVLIHGDLNFKNLMEHRSGDKVDNIIFLDFQICFWASPALDILYALYMMIESSVRQAHRDTLILNYYEAFRNTLQKLEITGRIPTLFDLNVQLLKKGPLELIQCICMLPCFFVNLEKLNIDLEQFFTSPNQAEIRRKVFQIPELMDIIKVELPRFLNQGFLN